jgi:GAF domain-containing protein
MKRFPFLQRRTQIPNTPGPTAWRRGQNDPVTAIPDETRDLELYRRIASYIYLSNSVAEALSETLNAICERFQFDLGKAFVCDSESPTEAPSIIVLRDPDREALATDGSRPPLYSAEFFQGFDGVKVGNAYPEAAHSVGFEDAPRLVGNVAFAVTFNFETAVIVEFHTFDEIHFTRDLFDVFCFTKTLIAFAIEKHHSRRACEECSARLAVADQAKAEFLAKISHELRTPLTGVICAAALLENSALTEEQKEFVDIVKLSGENLLATLGETLDIRHIEKEEDFISKRRSRHPFKLEVLEYDGRNLQAILDRIYRAMVEKRHRLFLCVRRSISRVRSQVYYDRSTPSFSLIGPRFSNPQV